LAPGLLVEAGLLPRASCGSLERHDGEEGDETMIGRWWRGETTEENAQPYEEMLLADVLPDIHRVPGYKGAYLLRRAVPAGFEFATLTLWDSLYSVRAFAGADHERAVVHAEAAELLTRYDERSLHYEILATPATARRSATG
jgi:heme-degrading monooxygenase HmoA